MRCGAGAVPVQVPLLDLACDQADEFSLEASEQVTGLCRRPAEPSSKWPEPSISRR